MPTIPTPAPNKNPFGSAQTMLFKYLLTHPGCTMAEIREDCFTDRTGNYVWNLISENRNYIEQREIGTGLADKFYVRMDNFAAIVDIKAYVQTGRLIHKLKQTSFAFDRVPA